MNTAIAVVAHTKRADQAHQLMETVGAQYMAMDNGTYGCNANHIRCWTYLAKQPTQWSLVLEDDAQPINGFTDQLDQALRQAPTGIVSFYLGNPTWWKPNIPDRARRLTNAGQQADTTNASWIITNEFLHGVGIAVRTSFIPDMLNGLSATTAIDYAIRDWATHTNRDIAHAWPSLLDHADQPTLIQRLRRNNQPRKAWRIGTRKHWTNKTVDANAPRP